MSVDPLIQDPVNSQSINPYSYIMNNPLSGTDPTGYCSTGTNIKGKDMSDMGCKTTYEDNTSSRNPQQRGGKNNGAEVLVVQGPQQDIMDVGSELEKHGGRLIYGVNEQNGTSTAAYEFGSRTGLGKYSDMYFELANTIGDGAATFAKNLIPNTINGMTQWSEEFLHLDKGSLGRMNQWHEPRNEVAQLVAGDFGQLAAVAGAFIPVMRGYGISGRLNVDTANTFLFGIYTDRVLTQPMILTRYYDNTNAFAKGRFMTEMSSLSGSQFINRMGLALRPEWNNMTRQAYWEIPAGVRVFSGRAGPQMPWLGGKRQHFIPELNNLKRVNGEQ